MDWPGYVNEVIGNKSTYQGLEIHISGSNFPVPPILIMSLDLIDHLLASGEKHLAMVFPQIGQVSLLLSLLKILQDVHKGKVTNTYDPASFKKGQKLKCKNCTVEFDRIDETDGIKRLWVFTSDCRHGIPIELAPHFQLTETNKKLSRDRDFAIVKKQIAEERAAMSSENQILSLLMDNKSYFQNMIFNVTPIGKARELIDAIDINGIRLKDLLLIGHADVEGDIDILNSGQLQGDPFVVLAPDLYAVNEAVKKDSDVKLLLINTANDRVIQNQLDVLDVLRGKGLPIIYLMDTINSFELDLLENRGFYVWRWDEESICNKLFGRNDRITANLKNCARRRVKYLNCDSKEINDTFTILSKNRNEVSESTANVQKLYDKLFSLAFSFLRAVSEMKTSEKKEHRITIEFCKSQLQEEKRFISTELYENLNTAISNFDTILVGEYQFPKITSVVEHLCSSNYKRICIIVPQRSDPSTYQNYWTYKCNTLGLGTEIEARTIEEYINCNYLECDLTIVPGWINKDKMRKILYGYQTEEYLVILYDCEKRWKDQYVNSWEKKLHCGQKKRIIDKIIPSIDTSNFKDLPAKNIAYVDELEEIHTTLRLNKYKEYILRDGIRGFNEVIEAIPINYAGGCFAFYKQTHKIISVTDIIIRGKSEIKMINPNELEVGDLVVVREAQQDLIREIADQMLKQIGESDLRSLATKWRQALEAESVFSCFEEIYSKLKEEGCKKTKFTIKQWINNDDIICPQDKNDLMIIARATQDIVLGEMIDDIYEAGRQVRVAHVQAGKHLSDLLKNQIPKILQEQGGIDPYNIWEPISMQFEDIGTIKILKVIDVGMHELVDAGIINRLIDEF